MKKLATVFAALALGTTACKDTLVPDANRHYSDVATGGYHTCALADDGTAYCWGRGSDGELGTGDTQDRHAPATVQTSVKFTQISAGAAHTCALGTDQRVYCWGWNVYYQMGDTTTYPHLTPKRIALDSAFSSVSAGDYHTCAIRTTGTVYCWGYGRWGQNGNGLTWVAIYPIAVPNFKARSISAGGEHTCAISTAGGAYCWGSNEFGQLGIASDVPSALVPTPVAGSVAFSSIDAGENHTCAVSTNAVAYCWGYNEYGQVGDATPWRPGLAGPGSPSQVILLSGVVSVAAGTNSSCAIDTAGQTWCWGRGVYGQNGVGSTDDQITRQRVLYQFTIREGTSDLLSFSKLALGGSTHTCALGEGTVFCWGTGTYGQLGIQTSFTTTPQPVAQQ